MSRLHSADAINRIVPALGQNWMQRPVCDIGRVPLQWKRSQVSLELMTRIYCDIRHHERAWCQIFVSCISFRKLSLDACLSHLVGSSWHVLIWWRQECHLFSDLNLVERAVLPQKLHLLGTSGGPHDTQHYARCESLAEILERLRCRSAFSFMLGSS